MLVRTGTVRGAEVAKGAMSGKPAEAWGKERNRAEDGSAPGLWTIVGEKTALLPESAGVPLRFVVTGPRPAGCACFP
jgi:hypothetical protein